MSNNKCTGNIVRLSEGGGCDETGGIIPLGTELGSGGGGKCTFDGVYQTPVGHVTGTTCQEWIDLHFPSQNPSAQIRGTVSFGFYEVGRVLTTPLIEGRGSLGSNPAGTLTQLELFNGGGSMFIQANPTPGTWYGTNDGNVTIVLGTTETYTVVIDDDQGRSATANGSYVGTYPYYGTTSNITTLTKQTLMSIGSAYFPLDMVAETGGDKYKADFETANISITGVEFYNTVASAWQWMGGSKANSLTLWDTTAVTHTVQGSVVNFTRFTHNGADGGVLQVRFYTT